MSYIVFLLLLSTTSLSIVATLQCYSTSLYKLNYTVTSATLPSFDDSEVVSATRCQAQVVWHKNPTSSDISLSAAQPWIDSDAIGDEILADVQLFDFRGDSILRAYRSMTYICSSSDFCNNQTTLKRILDALFLEERFPEEFYTLINITNTFDNNTAATCLRFGNTTSTCEIPDLEFCQSCKTDVYRLPSGSETICASCSERTIGNVANSESKFLLNNRTRLYDRANIECQRERCNSLENINKIRQSTTILFNFDQFFGTSSTGTTLLPISVLFIALFMTFQFLNIC